MRALKAKFDGNVFVPDRKPDISRGAEAVVVVNDTAEKPKEEWKPPDAAEREKIRQELQAYIDEHLPGTKIDEWLVNLVGVVPPMTDEEIKDEYYMHFLERDDDEGSR